MWVLQRKRFDPKQMCHRQSRGTTGSVCVDRGTWLRFPTKWIREAFSPFVFLELALYMSCLIAGARWWSFPITLTYFYIYLLVMLTFFFQSRLRYRRSRSTFVPTSVIPPRKTAVTWARSGRETHAGGTAGLDERWKECWQAGSLRRMFRVT